MTKANIESVHDRPELFEKFRANRVFLPSGCCEKAKSFYACGKVLSSRRVAWFIETERWVTQPIYTTCGNPLCVAPRHLTLDKPDSMKPGQLKSGTTFTCWGRDFVSLQQVWEQNRCKCVTVNALRMRVERGLSLDRAVRAYGYHYNGVMYRKLDAIPRPEGVSITAMNYRLGCVYGHRKCTVAHALHKDWWDQIAPICRIGENIYEPSALRPTWNPTTEELHYMMREEYAWKKQNLQGDPDHTPTESERLDFTSPYFDLQFDCWRKYHPERPFVPWQR